MKIAAIFFGQPRFVNNHHCFKTQEARIFSQGDVDVFAHLWEPDESGYKFSTWARMYQCPSFKNDIEVFKEKWQPKVLVTETQRPFSNPKVFEIVKDQFYMTSGWDAAEHNFNIMLSHLYSLEKSIEIFENHVKETKTEYDFVVFLRTDLCIWDFPKFTELEKDYFFLSSIFAEEFFPDKCFVTNPKYVKGLKTYSYILDEENKETLKEIKGDAEHFKRESFLKHFSKNNYKQVALPVRIVRHDDDFGEIW
jgi:hypothetical protein